MFTTEKLLDLNKRSKIKKENSLTLMTSMTMSSSHKEIDLLLNLNNCMKTLPKTEEHSKKLQSKELTIMKHSNHKLPNIMMPSQLLMNVLVY